MVIAHDLRPARPLGPERIDQRLRIDFEVAFGLRVDVGGWPEGADPVAFAKQDTATFPGVRGGGEGTQAREHGT